MSLRLSAFERRRRALKFQVADKLDQMLEPRSTPIPIGAGALAISATPTLGQAASMHGNGGVLMR